MMQKACALALGVLISCGGTASVKVAEDAGATGLVGTAAGMSHPVNTFDGGYSRECIEGKLALIGDSGDEPTDTDAASENLAEAPEAGIDISSGSGPLTTLVIMDKSSSMAESWDGRSKWAVANDAFSKAIEGVLDNLTIGAILFPQPGNCDVASLESGQQYGFEPGRSFAAHWDATTSPRFPNGNTPLGRAFQVADFTIEAACNSGLLDARFRVIILTDGEPTCEEDSALFTRLPSEWRKLGIKTLVFGLPGSESAAQLLDAIAGSGGTSHYNAAVTPANLDQGFYAAVR